MTTHTIRLRGPWQCVPTGAASNAAPTTVSLPGSWRSVVATAVDPIQLVRKFNAPTGLEGQRVEMVVESCSAAVRVSLNGKVLLDKSFDDFPLRFNVDHLLAEYNEITIEPVVASATDDSCEIGLVSLVIHEPSRP